MARLQRKNSWTLVEQAGERCPDSMQRLLNYGVYRKCWSSA
ncbi:hypothetical protein [Streptomyces sp. NPDC016626]